MTKAATQEKSARRSRNSAKTRESILVAARAFFRTHGYDQVGLREIAAAAGCDKALVHRYFGSKEEIFRAVLQTLHVGQPAGRNEAEVARNVVRHALGGGDRGEHNSPLDDVLITMRSMSSPQVADILRERLRDHLIGPLAQVLKGPDAELRATLAMAVIGGVTMTSELLMEPTLKQAMGPRLTTRIERMVLAALQSDDSDPVG